MSCNCNKCNDNPCSCKGCEPARYSCGFSIEVDPFDPYVWLFDNCGKLERIRIPKIPETCTSLTADFSSASLIYDSECGKDIITGCDLGSLINLDCLRDVEAPNADSCDLLVFDPGCSDCGGACKPRPAMWRNYHIPDSGDCEVEPDDDGYYHVLIKDDCGCIKECKIPVVPNGSAVINYIRDSVPDDPDFPWYYGCYNDHINLHLEQNVPQWFGKYDLEITVNYGIQAVKSTASKCVNFRSLMVPVVAGTNINVTKMSSILQDDTTYSASNPEIPWASKSMRGSITFIVPKGKEAYLHHEYRLRSVDSSAVNCFGIILQRLFEKSDRRSESAQKEFFLGNSNITTRQYQIQFIISLTDGTAYIAANLPNHCRRTRCPLFTIVWASTVRQTTCLLP